MEAYAQGGNDKFWEVHDMLFANQKQLGRAQLESYASDAGLDMDKVKAALDGGTHAKTISADQAVAAQFGARGTPYFYVNGRQVRGAMPFATFKTIIDEEIKVVRDRCDVLGLEAVVAKAFGAIPVVSPPVPSPATVPQVCVP